MISSTNLEFKPFVENKAKKQFDEQALRNSNASDIITPRFPFYVRDRLPVHILENYELYVKFIETYFEWLGITNNINQIPYLMDITNVPSNLLIHHKELFAHLFPDTSVSEDDGNIIYDWNNADNSVVDIRRFLSFVRQFYLTKGTEESSRFLLSSLFGIDAASIDFDYPKVQLCILSDAIWVPNLLEDTDTLGNIYSGYWADSRKTLSGGVRFRDDYFQEFSYSITSISTEASIGTADDADYEFTTKPIKDITHPAGFKLFNNVGPDSYIPAPPGPIDTGYSERPLIGNYLCYRFDTTLDAREPFPDVCAVQDLFPCGFNPYTTNPLNGTPNCFSSSVHNPNGFPIGYTYGAAAEAAGYTYTADTYNTAEDRGYTFWTVSHHPASWADGIDLGIAFGNIRLGDLVYLIPDSSKNYNASPNDPDEDVSTCTLA
tara:strand:- start:2585 stop:3883 length:1299 start_codon:yes stop_codon:yes gene_type:complete